MQMSLVPRTSSRLKYICLQRLLKGWNKAVFFSKALGLDLTKAKMHEGSLMKAWLRGSRAKKLIFSTCWQKCQQKGWSLVIGQSWSYCSTPFFIPPAAGFQHNLLSQHHSGQPSRSGHGQLATFQIPSGQCLVPGSREIMDFPIQPIRIQP